MKLTILGNYGPYPPAGGTCSSYLIDTGSKKILIDAGSGSLSELQKHCSLFEIDVIILSHLHYDHCADAMLIKYAFSIAPKKRPVKKPLLFIPGTPAENFAAIADPCLEVRVIENGMRCSLAGVVIEFARVPHSVECYAVKITHAGKVFVFSGDTADTDIISKFSEKATLLLIDSGMLSRDLRPGALHFTVKAACEVGKGAKKTVLTHFSPVYKEEEILSEVCFDAELSQKGSEYEF